MGSRSLGKEEGLGLGLEGTSGVISSRDEEALAKT
jgi:hypothetical protein